MRWSVTRTEVAARILDADEAARVAAGQLADCFGLEIGHGAAGHVIEYDRQVVMFSKVGEDAPATPPGLGLL
jgi:hypothetical protein